MSNPSPDVVVAGHICLDLIPDLSATAGGMAGVCIPGKLTNIGPVTMATGGAVSNVGLALHRLGVKVALMGKIGDDGFGAAAVEIFRRIDPELTEGMIVAENEQTSYTIVLSPPGEDRAFLHCTGANDTFAADDVDYDHVAAARLLHFGYPPIMRRMFADGGDELADMLRRVRDRGVMVSLDMSAPDPDSQAGRADWPRLLAAALPHVDLFAPSLDEILFMLDPSGSRRPVSGLDVSVLGDTADRLIDLGAPVVALKLGSDGMYLKTAADPDRLAALDLGGDEDAWVARELLAPCFEVDVVGTTGSGDCTIAGLLAGLLRGQGPVAAATTAVAVGACNCEAADANSGLLSWDATQARVGRRWARLPTSLDLSNWRRIDSAGLWAGPTDPGGR